VQEDGGSEDKTLGRSEGTGRASDEAGHLPERVEVGDVVHGERGELLLNLAHKNRRLLAKLEQVVSVEGLRFVARLFPLERM